MRPYRSLPIVECGEPLVAIPTDQLVLTNPHPYAAFGAPYGHENPWQLRSGVLGRLIEANTALNRLCPGWKIKVFDAYRPNRVQSFMVAHEFMMLSGGRVPEAVADPERSLLLEQTYRIWAEPSSDPATPPPHSTGAAIDLTLADGDGNEVPMGSPIDENSDRSNPDYFEHLDASLHDNRQLLLRIMSSAGFARHPCEWWHFSWGDQMWAWQENTQKPDRCAVARYGRADLTQSSKSEPDS